MNQNMRKENTIKVNVCKGSESLAGSNGKVWSVCFFECVDTRSSETLKPIIVKHIKPDTTIISDCWKAYTWLSSRDLEPFTPLQRPRAWCTHQHDKSHHWGALKRSLLWSGNMDNLNNFCLEEITGCPWQVHSFPDTYCSGLQTTWEVQWVIKTLPYTHPDFHKYYKWQFGWFCTIMVSGILHSCPFNSTITKTYCQTGGHHFHFFFTTGRTSPIYCTNGSWIRPPRLHQCFWCRKPAF